MAAGAEAGSRALARIHATSVAVHGRGVCLLGPPGSGKSDLGLRLIDGGAVLISDDQTEVIQGPDGPMLSPPMDIAGQIEVRGVGILRMPYRRNVRAMLAVSLVPSTEVDRLPAAAVHEIAPGLCLPVLRLHGVEASVPAKIRAALANLPPG